LPLAIFVNNLSLIMRKIFFLLLGLLILSCKKDKDGSVFYSKILDNKFALLNKIGEIKIRETRDRFIGVVMEGRIYSKWVVILDRVQSKIYLVNKKTGEIDISFGSKGEGPGEMVDPRHFDISKDGRIYVQDIRRVSCFDTAGRFLYSLPFPPPGLVSAERVVKVRNDRIYLTVIEDKYSKPKDRYKSRSIGVFDLHGNLLDLFGVHDEIAKTFTYGAGSTWFDFDRFGNIYSVDWKTYRIYKYDSTYKLVKVFGFQGKFRLPVEDIPWNLPFPEISKRLMKSSATESIIVSGDYVFHQFYDLTEEAVRARNHLYNRYYLKVYDLDGNYIPSDIELPGILLDVDENGKLYICESDEPGNKRIGIYELKVIDRD